VETFTFKGIKADEWIVKTFVCPKCGYETIISGCKSILCAIVSCPNCAQFFRGKTSDTGCKKCERRVDCLTNHPPVVSAKKVVEFLKED
jgi:hypothetical protein